MEFCFFFFKLIYFIYLFLAAALGLLCCAWVFSSCGEQGLLFVVVHVLLIAVASLVFLFCFVFFTVFGMVTFIFLIFIL